MNVIKKLTNNLFRETNKIQTIGTRTIREGQQKQDKRFILGLNMKGIITAKGEEWPSTLRSA